MMKVAITLFFIYSVSLLSAQCSQLEPIKGKINKYIAYEDHFRLLTLLQNTVSPLDRINLDEDCMSAYDKELKNALEKINSNKGDYRRPYGLYDWYYFAYGNIQLSYEKGVYYFTKNKGEVIQQLGHWDTALPFTLDGYSQVQKIEDEVVKRYLIDTAGNKYLMATDMSSITESITGLHLSRLPNERELHKIDFSKIKILILDKVASDNIFSFISQFDNLVYLSIKNTNLDTVFFNGLKNDNLRCLTLKNCNLSEFPDSITSIKELSFLDVSDNNFDFLPNNISQLKSLEVLLLNTTKKYGYDTTMYTPLPTGFSSLEKLKILRLDGHKIRSSVEEISKLNNLEILTLKYCYLDTNIIDFGVLEQLAILDLSNNSLKDVPIKTYQSVSRMKCLVLDYNPISNLNEELFQHKSLEYLSLTSNRIESISESIRNLRNLIHLDLSDNYLKNLPMGVNELTCLKEISLEENIMTDFPQQLCELSELRSINIGRTGINKLPDCIQNLSKLKILFLSKNGINQIPEFIFELQSLNVLFINGNPLKSLPHEISQLKTLRVLIASQCLLIDVPESLFSMNNLVILYLDSNQFRSFPPRLQKMENLYDLNLSNCDKLPKEEVRRIKKALIVER